MKVQYLEIVSHDVDAVCKTYEIAHSVNFSEPDEFLGAYAIHDQDHMLEHALDNELMELALPAIRSGEKLYDELTIVNTNRVVPTFNAVA